MRGKNVGVNREKKKRVIIVDILSNSWLVKHASDRKATSFIHLLFCLKPPQECKSIADSVFSSGLVSTHVEKFVDLKLLDVPLSLPALWCWQGSVQWVYQSLPVAARTVSRDHPANVP